MSDKSSFGQEEGFGFGSQDEGAIPLQQAGARAAAHVILLNRGQPALPTRE